MAVTRALLALLAAAAVFAYHPTHNEYQEDACLDYRVLGKEESSRLPHKNGLPWTRIDTDVKILKSQGLSFQWMWHRSNTVRGLSQQTVEDILIWLDGMHCSFIAWGDVVWKSVMKKKPYEMEGEVICPLLKLNEDCERRFGTTACSLEEEDGLQYLSIGHGFSGGSPLQTGPIRLFLSGSHWNLPLLNLSFTLDAMAIYDDLAGQVYLIDVSGSSLNDTCERNLMPAAPQPQRPQWEQGRQKHLLRYLELRGYDFRPAGDDLYRAFLDWLGSADHPWQSELLLQQWYCSRLMHGHLSPSPSPSTANSSALRCFHPPDQQQQQQLRASWQVAKEEIPALFYDYLEPAVKEVEMVFVEPHHLISSKKDTKKEWTAGGETEKRRVAAGGVVTVVPRPSTLPPSPSSSEKMRLLEEPLVSEMEDYVVPIPSSAVACLIPLCPIFCLLLFL